jgi:hypothetical protein
VILLMILVTGSYVGWAMRRDDSRRYVETNKRYYRSQLAQVEAQLAEAEA